MKFVQRNKDYKIALRNKCIMFGLLIFLYLSLQTEAAVCQKSEYILNDAAVPVNPEVTPYHNNIVKVNYTCPGPSDSKYHTECCSSVHMKEKCCPRTRYFYEIDKTYAAIIAISVTSVCILLTIIIIVCCFWSRCPLYSSCRTEFTPEIATYVSKEDNIDMDTMPREISKKNKFSPVLISNGNIPSGVDMEAI